MPILPPSGSAPYDSVTDVLNSARVRLNDKLNSLTPTGGTLLDNTDAFSHQVFNSAYRRFQMKLIALGSDRFSDEIVVEGVPAVGDTDPATQTYLDWFGFFDGQNSSTAPVLPEDLIMPLWISERWTEQNQTFPLKPNMENMVDGLPAWTKQPFNFFWQWRDNKIYMPGSLMSMDLRIGYAKRLPAILDSGGVRWFRALIPIPQCSDPLSWYVCQEFAIARAPGDPKEQQLQSMAAKYFEDQADTATRLWFKPELSKNQRVNVRRIPRNRGARGAWGAC